MNANRRKRIEDIIDMLNGQLACIEEIREEEQDAYDNLPEGIQNSERGEAMSEAAYELESAYDDLENIIDNLQDIIDR